jgi:hypothetical protein
VGGTIMGNPAVRRDLASDVMILSDAPPSARRALA